MFFALIDPFGIFQAYNSPQGIANFSHIDVRYPAPGHWKAMVWANPVFTGDGHNINFEFTTSKYTSYGKVSPSSVTLTPGASATINASFPTGTNAGDSSAAIVMKSPLGASADMPVSIRTLIPTSAATNTFHGVLTGGNGRGFDAESHKYFLDIPAGKKAVSVTHQAHPAAVPERGLRRVPGRSERAHAQRQVEPDRQRRQRDRRRDGDVQLRPSPQGRTLDVRAAVDDAVGR